MKRKWVKDNIFICSNGSCKFSSTTQYGFKRHRCTYRPKKKNQSSKNSYEINECYESNELNGNYNVNEDNDMDNIPVELSVHYEDKKAEEIELKKDEKHIEFIKILKSLSSGKNDKEMNDLLKLLADENFDRNQEVKRVKNMDDVRNCYRTVVEEKLSNEGFERIAVKDEETGKQHILYKRNVIEVLKKQISIASSEDIDLKPRTLKSYEKKKTCMETRYIKELYDWKRKEVIMNGPNNVIFEDNELHNCPSFVGLLQCFSDKTAASLSANSFVAYPFHIVFMNFKPAFRDFLIEKGYTIAAFLPTTSEDSGKGENGDESSALDEEGLEDIVDDFIEVEVVEENNNNKNERYEGMKMFRMCIENILYDIMHNSNEGFEVTHENKMWRCFCVLCSYCCDILEGKEIFGIRHGLLTNKPCILCNCTFEDMRLLKRGIRRKIDETLTMRRKVNEMMKKNGKEFDDSEILKTNSLSIVESFIEIAYRKYCSFIAPDAYSIYTFETLHNLYLGLSKILKICLYKYLGSEEIVVISIRDETKNISLRSKKRALLKFINHTLSQYEREYGVPSLYVDFKKKGNTNCLDGLYMEKGMKGMLQGRNFKHLDYVFPLVSSTIDTILNKGNKCLLTEVNTLYTEISTKVVHEFAMTGCNDEDINELEENIIVFKRKCVQLFERTCETGLITLKFHLLDHLCDNLRKFGTIKIINGAKYEQFNLQVKESYRLTSKRRGTATKETVDQLAESISMRHEKSRMKSTTSTIDRLGLTRDGFKIKLNMLNVLLNRTDSGESVRKRISPKVGHISRHGLEALKRFICTELKNSGTAFMDYHVTLNIVKSAYVECHKTPELSLYDKEKNIIKFRDITKEENIKKRVFCTNSFGSNRKEMMSYIYMKGGDDETPEYWFGKVLLLFLLTVDNTDYKKEFALIQYMTCTAPLNKSEEALGCLCLRWETEDEIDHTLKPDMEEVETGEWYGMIPINSICGTCQIVRSNIAFDPFRKPLPWINHRFFVNRFLPTTNI